MCEKIIRYDCSHMKRIAIPCPNAHRQQPQRQHHHKRRSSFKLCPDPSSSSSEEDTTSICPNHQEFEHLLKLCPDCDAGVRDQEVYQNSPRRRRPSASSSAAGSRPSSREDNQPKTPVSTRKSSAERSKQYKQQRPMSATPLGRVPEEGGGGEDDEEKEEEEKEEENEKKPGKGKEKASTRSMRSSSSTGFEARRGGRNRPGNIVTSRVDALRHAEGRASQSRKTPSPATRFTMMLDPSQIAEEPPMPSAPSSADSLVQKVKQGLHISKKRSDDSFACESARKIEKKRKK